MTNDEIERRIRFTVDFFNEEFKASFTVKLDGSILTREIHEIRSKDERKQFQEHVFDEMHKHWPHLSVEELREWMVGEWGDMKIDKSEANGIVHSLKHLSIDFNEARRLPKDQVEEVRRKLVSTANAICRRADEIGLLTSIRSLNKYFFDCTDDDKRERLFDLLVGYSKVTREDGPWGPTKYCCYYLFPGFLASEGHMPNDEIAIGMDATEAVVANAISEHSFRVVGYYSKGCEVIAEIIEAELKIGPAFGPKSQKLSSLSKPELTGEIAKVIASNKTRRWKAEDIRTKILEQNPGRTTSAKTIEKNLVYDQLLIF